MLLKDELNDILINFDTNFTDNERDIVKKLARDDNLDNNDFLKRFVTLYDVLIGLLKEETSILKVAKEQN